MKTLLALLFFSMTSVSASTLYSSCESSITSAAVEKFRNPEYGCYGNVSLIKKIDANTAHVTVDAVGGYGACTQKVYLVIFRGSERSCSIISINRLGLGGV